MHTFDNGGFVPPAEPATAEPETAEPETVAAERGIADLYDENGCAHPDAVPAGAPLLTGSALDETGWVRELIEVLNTEVGADLPVGDIVTTDVLVAVRALKAKHGIPNEQGIAQPENYIGPNVWAAVAYL